MPGKAKTHSEVAMPLSPRARLPPKPATKRLRRVARLLCLVGISALVIAAWFLGSYWSFHIYIEKPYDKDLLQVHVKGCAVNIVEGPKHTIHLAAMVRGIHWEFLDNGDATTVRYVRAFNAIPCVDAWRMQCDMFCNITIHAPSRSPPQLHVWQEVDDANPAVDVVARDVSLRHFRLVGPAGNKWNIAGPSLQFIGENVMFQEDIEVTLEGGMARCTRCRFGGAVWVKSQINSVYLEQVQTEGNVSVRWRQPMHRVCIGSTRGHVIDADPEGPWALCDTDLHRHKAYAFFDTNKDRYIDQVEMLEQLPAVLFCCGQKCPFASLCNSVAWKLLPADARGREGILPNTEWYANIRAFNFTNFVPGCNRLLRLTDATAASAAELDLGNVVSEGGEIRITFEDGETRAGRSDCGSGATEWEAFEPRDRLSGIRMLQRSAETMVQDYAPVYGALGSAEDVWVAIDVPAAPGIPATKWIYTTRPIFLFFEPAILHFLSFGVLTPPVVHLVIPFVGAGCEHNATARGANGTFCDEEARLLAMHAQLVQALRPAGTAGHSHIRGSVLLVGDGGRLWAFPRTYATGHAVRREFQYPLQSIMFVAVVLSLVLGVISGIAFIYLGSKVAQMLLRDKMRLWRARQRALQRYNGMGTVPDPSDGEEAPEHNPLEQPLLLLTAFIIAPVRQRTVNSVKRFLDSNCKYTCGRERCEQKYIYMSELMRRSLASQN